MKTKYKVLIALAIIAVLGLTGFLVWWFKFRNKPYVHKRVKEYIPPVKEDVHKKITKYKNTTEKPNSAVIPKVVYMTYHDIDGIPSSVLENIKQNCKGYRIEIHGDQSCMDFLYKYYGPDALQIFQEIKIGPHKADFWRYCILYAKGGYYFDIKTTFRKHLDEAFKISEEREWYTVLCDKKYVSCVYNGVIITPPRNPILWNALKYFYTHINVSYLTHVHYLFKLIQDSCLEPIQIGSNNQKNGWKCTIYREDCIGCTSKQQCSKHKGENCRILDASSREVTTVEPNFPWYNSYSISPISLLVMDGDKEKKAYSKPSIAIIGSFQYHYECVGFLLDILGENYDIHVYHDDKDGFVDLFARTYDFKSFKLKSSYIDGAQYNRCIILSGNDPITIEESKLVTRIIHREVDKRMNATEFIKLSPLVQVEAEYILPVYRTNLPFVYKREKSIVIVGDSQPSSSTLKLLDHLVKTTGFSVNHYTRVKSTSVPGVNNIVGAKANKIEEDISQCQFVLVTSKNDRFSGVIAMALSCKTPMIIDSFQAGVYKFPALVYTDHSDIVSKLQELQEQDYSALLKQVNSYTNSLLEKNRTICPPFAQGSFTLGEVKNQPAVRDWNGKIPYSVIQVHENRSVPKRMLNNMATLRTSAPGTAYTFYSVPECQEYIKRHYPAASDPYNSLIPGAYRCDLFRYIRLYSEGGVYMDSPYSIPEGVKIFGDIVRPEDTFVASWDMPIIEGRKMPAVHQGFIASVPKHPILKTLIENILDLVRRQEYLDNPLSITGPIMLARTMLKMNFYNGVRLLEHRPGEISDNKGVLINTRYPEYDRDRKVLQSGTPNYGELWERKRVYRNPNYGELLEKKRVSHNPNKPKNNCCDCPAVPCENINKMTYQVRETLESVCPGKWFLVEGTLIAALRWGEHCHTFKSGKKNFVDGDIDVYVVAEKGKENEIIDSIGNLLMIHGWSKPKRHIGNTLFVTESPVYLPNKSCTESGDQHLHMDIHVLYECVGGFDVGKEMEPLWKEFLKDGLLPYEVVYPLALCLWGGGIAYAPSKYIEVLAKWSNNEYGSQSSLWKPVEKVLATGDWFECKCELSSHDLSEIKESTLILEYLGLSHFDYPIEYENVENPYKKGQYLVWPKQNDAFMKSNHPSTFSWDNMIKQDILDKSKNLPKGYAIIDCGAHIGDGSIPVAAALKACGREDIIVYAIDPSIYKIQFIKEMAIANNLINVKALRYGLSDHISHYNIDATKDHSIHDNRINSGGTTWIETTSNRKEYDTTKFTTLDNLVASGEISEKIGYIHLDVEGMEHRAIIGGIRTIQKYLPVLSLEDNDPNSYKLDNILKPIGYRRIERRNSNNIYMM